MFDLIWFIIKAFLSVFGLVLGLMIIENFIRVFNHKRKNKELKFVDSMREIQFKPKFIEFMKWIVLDIFFRIKNGARFNEFGMTMYCGRMGDGKTIGMVDYLEDIRVRFPKCKIYTNFFYKHQTGELDSWRDLLTLKNGLDGVVFAYDEIHQDYNSVAWKDFPDELLSQISYLRKDKIKIIASSQVYGRVVKQLREQCFEVVECRTFLKRWTFLKCYDAKDYDAVIENPEKLIKLRCKWKRSFVQTDKIRSLYDTDLKASKLAKKEFLDRDKRTMKVI